MTATPAKTFNVRDYGATGTGRGDDGPAIQKAIGAAVAAKGGTVLVPAGRYLVRQTVTIPASSTDSLYVTGEGKRDRVIYGEGSSIDAVVRVGVERGRSASAAPPTGGESMYGKITDLTINGSRMGGAGAVGLHLSRALRWVISDVNVEGFASVGGIGMLLEGAASANAPHTWRCAFYNVLVATSRRPLVLRNADENDFFNCHFGALTGIRPDMAGSRSHEVILIEQGRNNRFYGLLAQGDPAVDVPDSASASYLFRASYTGVRFAAPRAGDVKGNQVYGLVVEGCDVGVRFDDHPNTAGNMVLGYNSSINRVAFEDDGARHDAGNVVWAPLHGIFHAGSLPVVPSRTFANGDMLPSVRGGSVFATANSSATSITGFVDGLPGQSIVIRLDRNTTLVDRTRGGTLRLRGAQSVVGTDEMIITLVNIGGNWYEQSRTVT